MEELTKENVLEFWKKATIEEQIENIDRVIEIIDSQQVVDMWKSTKNQVKCQNPNLIIRIIKEKLANGTIYRPGLWENTPSEVQEQTIEEVMQLYNSEFMIRRIWKETHESVKSFAKGTLAKAFKYDERLLKKYEIPEYIPAPPGMLGKKEIDDIVWELMQLPSWENIPYFQEEAKLMMTEEMPITSMPYFFKQIADKILEEYVKMFWDSINKDVQYQILEDVLLQIPLEEARVSLWNEIDFETKKTKIKELVKKNKGESGSYLISITETQINRDILEEMINENETNIFKIWGALSQEIQLEYFQTVIKINTDKAVVHCIWNESCQQVQRVNFSQMLQEDKDNINAIQMIIRSAKLKRSEVIDYILQNYEGKQLEEIIKRYELDVESVEKLRGKISSEESIKIVIRNASELTMEKLEELSESFNITTIQMLDENDNLGYEQREPYDVETYKKCRQVIDELLDGIDLSQQSGNPNREKIIFGEVIKRLANHISYDYETLEKLDDETATKEEKIRCSNMTGGLLNKTCVCAGYAEIVRNVFSCCGIEVRYIVGNNIEPGEAGHAWNQIKLDGTWYNMDLTWDRDRIVAGEKPLYLLKSDIEFIDHDEYNTKFCKMQKCGESVSNNDMKWYMYKKLEIPKTIDTSVRRVRRRRVERAYGMIAASQKTEVTNPEKREEANDKNK